MHWLQRKKPQFSAKSYFWKIRKNLKEMEFLKKIYFFVVSTDFFRNGTLQRAAVFCIAISASKCFLKAIKQPSRMLFIFCHIMGGPFFQTPSRGIKWCFWWKWKIYGGLLWQKAPKTTRAPYPYLFNKEIYYLIFFLWKVNYNFFFYKFTEMTKAVCHKL